MTGFKKAYSKNFETDIIYLAQDSLGTYYIGYFVECSAPDSPIFEYRFVNRDTGRGVKDITHFMELEKLDELK